ncbi:YbhB/YbcL family Raf kinase inhibitor-like protein [Halomonas huangheensis]|uniref:Phospholipid-binding protein n=1 Tax=Halomonas huangheensis TaxID=1178482 RepID=W1N4A6_9GAMM|nr:YbhB/YbcL family Raf kinase inhibitor-like protein [Halomonas huangheensis]ALM51830.1 phospholipid-binding protein [Halomonas huangheensis]ERL50348.1 hypothetical protein BJB45_04255 [Halomonas huangheensis]
MVFALSTLSVSSSAFDADGEIPKRNSMEAEDLSPALAWHGVPEGTRGIAIICHDPDAPLVKAGGYGFVHWVLYNLPATITSLDEGSDLGTKGVNDAGKLGYCGPLPPQGHGLHRYYFWVLALDTETDFPEGLTMAELLDKVEPNLLGMNRLLGTYQRA